jgi:esterase/lipase
MAAPLEMKELARYLGKRGIWVYAPRVKGHGTSPEDLATRNHEEWIESVDRAYAIIANLCKRVVVGGFSNGAGLALDLAARNPHVAGVFAVCPPLQLQDISSRLVPAVDVWNRLMKRVHLNEALMDFVDNNPENPDINYIRNPISGVRELERLMASVAAKLPRIQMPALIVQAQGDPVVNPKGSRKVFERLGTIKKTYVLVNFDRHGILLGEGSHRVHQTILNFIQDL